MIKSNKMRLEVYQETAVKLLVHNFNDVIGYDTSNNWIKVRYMQENVICIMHISSKSILSINEVNYIEYT